MTFCYLIWIFVCPRLRIPCAISSRENWASSVNRTVDVVAASRKIVYCCDLLVRGAAFLRGNTDRDFHDAEFSIPLSVLYQSSWKFYLYLCLGFACSAARTRSAFARGKEPQICLTFTVVLWCGILRSWRRCRHSPTAGLPFKLQKPCTNCMFVYSSCVNILDILTRTALLQNTATPV
jgi:hypothetical protein